LDATPDQFEQPHTQFCLERMELPGNGGLAEIDPAGRAAQPPASATPTKVCKWRRFMLGDP